MLPEGKVRFSVITVTISEQHNHPHIAPACIKFILSKVAYCLSNIGLRILLQLLSLIRRRCKVSFDTFYIIYYVVSCVLAEMCQSQPLRYDKYPDLVKVVFLQCKCLHDVIDLFNLLLFLLVLFVFGQRIDTISLSCLVGSKYSKRY